MRPIDQFLNLAGAAVAARATGAAHPAAARLIALLADPPVGVVPSVPLRPAVCAQVPVAMALMATALAAPFAALEPALAWQARAIAGAPPGFAEGHANAHLLGPQGLEQRGGLVAGFSLVAPNITYPDHHHPPEELYLVLSGGEWWQAGGAWHAPGQGGIVHNPPGILHAMRGTDVPLLALWFLLPDSPAAHAIGQ